MGTPDMAVPVLERLIEAKYNVVGVYTKPDRRAGRGRKVVPSPIKKTAITHHIPVHQPVSLRNHKNALTELKEMDPQLVVVAAYGLFLPPEFLAFPQFGCLNLHPSILPRHRGPSPVATAILIGDHKSGVSIIKLNGEMDAGPIIAQRTADISSDEGTDALTTRLFNIGADLFTEVLPDWINGAIVAKPQNESMSTITTLLERSAGEIRWSKSAVYLARMIRAFRPWPGTFTMWEGKILKIIEATSRSHSTQNTTTGTVIQTSDSRTAVVTGNGVLLLMRVQMEGRRIMTATEFIRGYPNFIGSNLKT